MPIPKRDIFTRNKYKWDAHLVLTTRGCPVKCEMCPVPVKEGVGLRFRPVEDVISDIKSLPYREFYFTDDTIMLPGKRNMKYLLKIMEQTADLDVSIFLASTMMMKPDPQFYRLLKKGGASSMYTVFGFDRISKELFTRQCSTQQWQQSIDLVRMNEDAGIHFFASYGVGFDYQDPYSVERILQFSKEAGIDLAEFYLNTPFPSTPFGVQAEREDRILHRHYNYWNTGNVVFQPRHFSPQQLLESFFFLWKEFYTNRTPQNTLRSFEINSTDVQTKL
jgi:radical SAM superfamily enzyme YgiQ (UPF0313 family)